MKIVVLSNLLTSLPVIAHFHTHGWLKAVVSTDKLYAHNLQVEDFCKAKDIPFYKVDKKGLRTIVKELFTELRPDLAIMCGFTYRIPAELFTMPPLGFFNIHFSLLPAYRGPAPVFWQIKNGETQGGVSIHKVDTGFDTGAVVMQQPVPFMPGETSGICEGRYVPVVYNMLLQLIKQLERGAGGITEIPLNEAAASYYPRPSATDMSIDWSLYTATQIENLVNACNPAGGGAITTFRQQIVRILEVSPVEGAGDAMMPGGTIIHADANGMYVQCMDKKILRINILRLNEGYITGFKFAALGIKAGDRFEHNISQYKIVNN